MPMVIYALSEIPIFILSCLGRLADCIVDSAVHSHPGKPNALLYEQEQKRSRYS